MENKDLLTERIELYEKLLNTEYKFYIGKKGKLKLIELIFSKSEFAHLLGFQYLKDRSELSNISMDKLYSKILNNFITFNDIQKSLFFHKIENRFLNFNYLEKLLDSSEVIYMYNYKKANYSKIKASYLLQCFSFSKEYYIFLDRYTNGSLKGKYFCRTFFEKSKIDFTQWQVKWILLRKEKIDLNTGALIFEQGRTIEELKLR